MGELIAFETEKQLKTFDAQALARLKAEIVPVLRTNAIFGRQASQTTIKLMTLTMLAHGEYRTLRQISAEVQKRRLALREADIRIQRLELKANRARQMIKRLESLLGDRSIAIEQHEDWEFQRHNLLIDANEADDQIAEAMIYVEGAMKDIAALADAYKQISKTSEIPEQWDEADFEAGEVEHHVKGIFTLGFRDCLQTTRVSPGCCEWSQQFGLHPFAVQEECTKYLQALSELDHSVLDAGHLHSWLEEMFMKYGERCLKVAIDNLGLTDLITRYSLHRKPKMNSTSP